MCSALGVPDWQGALETEEFTFLPAYGDDELHYGIPKSLALVDRVDKSPDFALEFVSNLNAPSPADSLFATINMCLARGGDARAAYCTLATDKPTATALPATFTPTAFWYLEATNEPQAVQQFAWEDVDRARVFQHMSRELGVRVWNALPRSSTLAARAAIECGIAAFLPRVPTKVTFEPRALLAALRGLNPRTTEGSVSLDAVIAYFKDSLASTPLKLAGPVEPSRRRDLALALAGRVVHHLAVPERTPRISDGPHIALRNVDGLPDPTVWDLSTPLLTTLPRMLQFDPFTRILSAGGRGAVTFFTRVPPLPKDLLTQRVVVNANLPPNISNVEAIDLTLRVGADLSPNKKQQPYTITLHPANNEAPRAVELKYRKANPKRYSARLRLVSEAGLRTSDWFDCTDDYLYIGTERLPAHSATVRASADLVQQAALDVALTHADEAGNLRSQLGPANPAVTFLMADIPDAARIRVTARDVSDANRMLVLEDLPCRSVGIDLLAFQDYGPHTIDVRVEFHSDASTADFEFDPEVGNTEPIVIRFTPQVNKTTVSYFATNMFRSRYRWRRATDDQDTPAEWSDYLSSKEPLTIHA